MQLYQSSQIKMHEIWVTVQELNAWVRLSSLILQGNNRADLHTEVTTQKVHTVVGWSVSGFPKFPATEEGDKKGMEVMLLFVCFSGFWFCLFLMEIHFTSLENEFGNEKDSLLVSVMSSFSLKMLPKDQGSCTHEYIPDLWAI